MDCHIARKLYLLYVSLTNMLKIFHQFLVPYTEQKMSGITQKCSIVFCSDILTEVKHWIRKMKIIDSIFYIKY